MMTANSQIQAAPIQVAEEGRIRSSRDQVAVEEPLEFRLRYQTGDLTAEKSISVTMRTPGDDRLLAAGFLFTEGIIQDRRDLQSIQPATQRPGCNTIQICLRPGTRFDPAQLQRHFYTTSSCGVCGKSSLQALRAQGCRPVQSTLPSLPASIIWPLPARMRKAQTVFASTGGLHAAALFTPAGDLVSLKEDVGRHNALDKLIGEQFLAGKLPLGRHILLVSGRTSFEIVQKVVMAGVPILAAVSAPSSLAVDLAEEFRLTLLGFVRGKSFNIYSCSHRILET